MATVTVHMPDETGNTGHTLFLYSIAGSLLNAGGDTLTEVGSSGVFQATVAESLAADYLGQVTNSGSALVFYGFLYSGETTLEQVPVGTSGDATLANQTTILSRLATTSIGFTPQTATNKLTLIRGDSYDDATRNHGPLDWETSLTITGATIRFTIRDIDDTILIDHDTTGVTGSVSGTDTARVELTNEATELLTVTTHQLHKFDVVVYWSSTEEYTVALGNCIVLEDQSR